MKALIDKNALLFTSRFVKQRKYWLKKLSADIAPTELVFNDRKSIDRPGQVSETFALNLSETMNRHLIKLSKGNNLSIYIILLAALKALVYRYTGSENVAILSPVNKNNASEMTLNRSVAVLDPVRGEFTFKELLLAVRGSLLEAYENQDYPFDKLMESLFETSGVKGNQTISSILCSLRNIHDNEIIETITCTLSFTFSREEEVLKGQCRYNGQVLENSYAAQVANHLLRFLEQAAADVHTTIRKINFFSEEERERLLEEFNRTCAEYAGDKTLHRLFEEQVEKSPDSTAVVFHDVERGSSGELRVLTYRKLNEKANQTAAMLRAAGAETGDITGLMVPRNEELAIGVLGILKAGGVCLPIDSRYPGKRLAGMLTDSAARFLLKETAQSCEFCFSGVVKDLDAPGRGAFDTANIHKTFSSNRLAYVIFTSGSTGKPKGTLLKHVGINNHAHAKIKELEICPHDVLCHNLNVTFVASIWQFFAPLFMGTYFYIYRENVMANPDELFSALVKHCVTVVEVVPSLLNSFLEIMETEKPPKKLDMLRMVVLTGEKVTPLLVNKFYRFYSIDLVNAYGQSECSDDTLHYKIPFDTGTVVVPVGRPANNTRVYVLDHCSGLQPPGVQGQLFIGGHGLAAGYLNRPELTAEKFIFDFYKSYRSYRSYISRRVFKTGDLVRWLPDGNIEFLGRVDHQVKIRGFRVELGEIESQLLSHHLVKEAVVVAREQLSGDTPGEKDSQKYLCAYVVPVSQGIPGEARPVNQLTETVLREHLSGELPDYMVPAYIVLLETMPLTPSGKIERKSLPEPEKSALSTHALPQDDIEKKLADIWAELLLVKSHMIGIDDNFFQLGGHSLTATILVARIHKVFHVKFALSEVFRIPSIREMAKLIREMPTDVHTSLRPSEKKDYYELASPQKRLFILQQMEQQNVHYNIPKFIPLVEAPEREKLEATFKRLIYRHESLRTSFVMLEKEPIQRIHHELRFTMEQDDRGSGRNMEERFGDFVRPFDLSRAPLLRVGIINEPVSDKPVLMVDMHHLISDGTSIFLLIRDFLAFYHGEDLPLLSLQYKDYVRWQNSELQQGLIKEQEAYWLKEFTLESPVLNLPLDYKRPLKQSFAGSSVQFAIGPQETKALVELAASHGATMFMVLLAVFNILLAKLSGQEDIVIGTGVAGRRHEDLNHIIGMFVNTLAIRGRPSHDQSFPGFLQQLKEKTLQAFENQEYPFETLVEKITVARDASRNPVFDVVFALQNQDSPAKNIPGTKIAARQLTVDYKSQAVKFDLTLHGIETGDRLEFYLEYCTRLFKKETIRKFIGYFKRIIESIINHDHQRLGEIEIIGTEEKQQVLYRFNDTAVDYPREKTIDELFAEQARLGADKSAVVNEEQTITYDFLNQRADSLALYLQARNIKREEPVGIMASHSIGMITGLLGILKAGCAYLPINVEYPAKRQRYLLADANAGILLTDYNDVDDRMSTVIRLDEPGIYDCKGTSVKSHRYDNLAYIIYTSGSTGNPKGIMVVHRSVVRLVKNTDYVEFPGGDRVLQTGALEFDASTFEIWGALLNGLQLFLVHKDTILAYEKLKETIQARRISTIWMTAPLFNRMVDADVEIFSGLRNLLVGGDVLSPVHINRVTGRFPALKIINGYGPTENTTFSATHHIKHQYEESIPIGKPIANSTAYIVDKSSRLQPPGIPGELLVGGDGVSRGYLNNPELTAERFISGPFKFYMSYRSYRTYIPKRIYKTGDLACWLSDGTIQYLGRIDHQVKIRGYRIELGEIESRLLAHPAIKEAVVITGTANKERYLCAYIVYAVEIPVTELRRDLSAELPGYMIPAYFVPLEKIPLTVNGKVDRRALPGIETVPAPASRYKAPGNPVESQLVDTWSEVLEMDRERIGIDDDFFEMGGHSLKATHLSAKMHKTFNIHVPLAEIFVKPTVRELARFIMQAAEDKYISITPVEKKEYYLLSSNQKSLYILWQMNKQAMGYNNPQLVALDGDEENLQKEKLEQVFNRLIQRHESLRTCVDMVDNEPVQRVLPAVDFQIDYFECSKENQSALIEDFIRPFDLSQAPLLRAGFLHNGKENFLIIDMHHIITDATSQALMTREFLFLYREIINGAGNGKELSPLRIQYKDFAHWQNRPRWQDRLQSQKEYWLKEFNGDIPVLFLPTDYPRPELHNFQGGITRFTLNPTDTQTLRNMAKETDTTLFMVLLSIYNVLLYKLSGQEDIVVGTPIAGRRHPDLDKIIGIFINMLPLRNYPAGNKTVKDFLTETKTRTLAAFENQDYPFEELVKKLAIPRDLNRNPLFVAVINLLNQFEKNGDVNDPDLETIAPALYSNDFSNFDLVLYCLETGKRIDCMFKYYTQLFKPETIERFVGYFKKIIHELSGDIEKKTADIEILSSEEKRKLLEGARQGSSKGLRQKKKMDRKVQENIEVKFNF